MFLWLVGFLHASVVDVPALAAQLLVAVDGLVGWL